MKLRVFLSALLLLATAGTLGAHDLFLKLNNSFVSPGATLVVQVLNGTFSKSENSITRDRVLDVSVVSPAGRVRMDTSAWSSAGDTSTFRVRTGAAGTYVIGASTRPRMIELKAKDFNGYLASDGIPDILAERRRTGELGKTARERYAKHVKALVQVGDARAGDFGAALGYPAEIVPLENPYTLRVGGTLRVRTLVDGKPAGRQYVLYGGRTSKGARIAQVGIRSNADGIARIPIRQRGVWFVKFINMTKLTGDAEADYESKWATLTYEVR